ncbi:MAG TPA: hypothetical protein VFA69_10455 [Candidatus Nitrosotalea sp.]|nr:hypothetical protein [Candidatus Nitrosotalea sp.]
MTLPKPSAYKVKTGRKTKRERKNQDSSLRMFFNRGHTPMEASYHARCGYDYALKKFREFSITEEDQLQQYHKRHPPDDPRTESEMVKDFLIKHLGKSRYEHLF